MCVCAFHEIIHYLRLGNVLYNGKEINRWKNGENKAEKNRRSRYKRINKLRKRILIRLTTDMNETHLEKKQKKNNSSVKRRFYYGIVHLLVSIAYAQLCVIWNWYFMIRIYTLNKPTEWNSDECFVHTSMWTKNSNRIKCFSMNSFGVVYSRG